MSPSLSKLLSQVVVAMTIELDNEFEHRFRQAGGGARVGSVVIWSNFLRFVGRGITVGELIEAVGLPKARALSMLGGVARWGYVSVGQGDSGKRDDDGSGRGAKSDQTVRLTPAGERAAAIWAGLAEEINARWKARFDGEEIGQLERLLQLVDEEIGGGLPDYLPIITSTNGMALELPSVRRRHSRRPPLITLLAHALLAYTKEFESRSELSLALSANLLRVLKTSDTRVDDIPTLIGVSKEAVVMSITGLARTEFIAVEGSGAKRTVRLTQAGQKLRVRQKNLHDQISDQWETSFGPETIGELRSSLERILAHPDLSQGLTPYPDGWRAGDPYAERNDAFIADPRGRLPHHPMVLPRGGWPDGS